MINIVRTNLFIKKYCRHLKKSANNVFGIAWGKGIKKGYVYDEIAYNYDFGVTMAACLGVTLPNANGIVLDIFERE